MGLLDKLAQKHHEQGIDKKIKQAKELMAEEKYPAACSLLMELRHTHYGRNADRYRYDEVYKLHVECEERSMDQAIEQAKTLMSEGNYREAREVLREYVWNDVYRCDEANILYDACERAEAGEPQPVPAAAPKTAPALKPEVKAETKQAPKSAASATEGIAPKKKRMPAFEAVRQGQEYLNAKAQVEKQPAPIPKPEAKPQSAAKSKEQLEDLFQQGAVYDKKGNSAEAVRCFRAAAEQGYAKAQYHLGGMYDIGQGVKQDYAEAAKWFRAAAEQGLAVAQYDLGCMYAKGQGVAQNDTEAVKWYRAAAEQGITPAQYNMGLRYANGRGVKQDDAEAARWYRAAADKGDAKAQLNLAVLYGEGRGVKRDWKAATQWAERAKRGYAQDGNQDGVERAEKLLAIAQLYL